MIKDCAIHIRMNGSIVALFIHSGTSRLGYYASMVISILSATVTGPVVYPNPVLFIDCAIHRLCYS